MCWHGRVVLRHSHAGTFILQSLVFIAHVVEIVLGGGERQYIAVLGFYIFHRTAIRDD